MAVATGCNVDRCWLSVCRSVFLFCSTGMAAFLSVLVHCQRKWVIKNGSGGMEIVSRYDSDCMHAVTFGVFVSVSDQGGWGC